MTLHLVSEIPVSDNHGCIIGWITPAGDYWLAYHQSVFGTVTCCGAHDDPISAADAVRDRQEARR